MTERRSEVSEEYRAKFEEIKKRVMEKSILVSGDREQLIQEGLTVDYNDRYSSQEWQGEVLRIMHGKDFIVGEEYAGVLRHIVLSADGLVSYTESWGSSFSKTVALGERFEPMGKDLSHREFKMKKEIEELALEASECGGLILL